MFIRIKQTYSKGGQSTDREWYEALVIVPYDFPYIPYKDLYI